MFQAKAVDEFWGFNIESPRFNFNILKFWKTSFHFSQQVLPLVVLFIAAYSFSFSLLSPSDQGFNSIPVSLLTTFVMMTGEIDYRDTFLASSPLHALQKIFLVLFILMISIAIMNLLTGLAVDDTNEIMKRSKEEKRMNKVLRYEKYGLQSKNSL